MMHGAPNGVIDDETICERRVVMRALGSYCKVVFSTPHDERFFATDATADDRAVGEIVNINATGKIQDVGFMHEGPPVIGFGAAAP
jgi:hypothetical protein